MLESSLQMNRMIWTFEEGQPLYVKSDISVSWLGNVVVYLWRLQCSNRLHAWMFGVNTWDKETFHWSSGFQILKSSLWEVEHQTFCCNHGDEESISLGGLFNLRYYVGCISWHWTVACMERKKEENHRGISYGRQGITGKLRNGYISTFWSM